jgi:hypothetical protein
MYVVPFVGAGAADLHALELVRWFAWAMLAVHKPCMHYSMYFP